MPHSSGKGQHYQRRYRENRESETCGMQSDMGHRDSRIAGRERRWKRMRDTTALLGQAFSDRGKRGTGTAERKRRLRILSLDSFAPVFNSMTFENSELLVQNSYMRFVPRAIQPAVLEASRSFPATAVTAPRRT